MDVIRITRIMIFVNIWIDMRCHNSRCLDLAYIINDVSARAASDVTIVAFYSTTLNILIACKLADFRSLKINSRITQSNNVQMKKTQMIDTTWSMKHTRKRYHIEHATWYSQYNRCMTSAVYLQRVREADDGVAPSRWDQNPPAADSAKNLRGQYAYSIG